MNVTFLADSQWAYNMLISGFILGIVIFVLFLWQAINNYITVKQIGKFEGKTKKIFKDKYAWWVIRMIELSICVLMLIEIIFFIIAEVMKAKWDGTGQIHGTPVTMAAVHNIFFLVMAAVIISYMAVAYLWNGTIIVVIDQDNLITSSNVAPKHAITVSRVLKFPHMFKITYRDPDLKGNLKEIRLRYSKKLDMFLSRNGYYKGDRDD